MKIMRKKIVGITALLALVVTAPVHAALDSVSGLQAGTPAVLTEVTAAGVNANVAVSLATGFPIWYKDSNNLKLELCIDQTVAKQGGGTFTPCIIVPPSPGSPVSFPNNFGAEAFYWAAVAFDNLLTSTVPGSATPVTWSAVLVMAHEAGFFNLGTEGTQSVFSRIRLRIAVPVPGTYRVIHPFGQRDYVVTDVTAGRGINQTQDIGILYPLTDNLLTSLSDRNPGPGGVNPEPLPAFPAPAPSSISFAPNGIVDTVGKSVGPFLVSNVPFITAANGARYLSDPGTDLVPLEVPINNGPNGNLFSIELIGDVNGGPIPAGVFLNAVAGTQLVSISQFQLATNGGALFSGVVSLKNNGGFASVRSAHVGEDLRGLDAFVVRVRGDGRRYKFTVRTESGFDTPIFQAAFTTLPGEWQEHRLAFKEFVPTFRGRVLTDVSPFNPAKVTAVGFIIADKQDGPFRLELAWIKALSARP